MQGQYDLIIKTLNGRFDAFENKIDKRFDRVEERVENCDKFRWRLVGFSAGVVATFSFLGFIVSLVFN